MAQKSVSILKIKQFMNLKKKLRNFSFNYILSLGSYLELIVELSISVKKKKKGKKSGHHQWIWCTTSSSSNCRI